MRLATLIAEAESVLTGKKRAPKLSDTQKSLLHALCTSADGVGTGDARQRAPLKSMEKMGLVTVVDGYFPTDKYTGKSGASYTATVTTTGRELFASLKKES